MQFNRGYLFQAITGLFLAVFLSGPVLGDPNLLPAIRFEAEGGTFTGPLVKVSDAVEGYSGAGYVTGFQRVDPNDEMVMVAVYAHEAEDYPLIIGYRSHHATKKNRLFVNDIDVVGDHIYYPMSAEFTELAYGAIPLQAGTNTVKFAVAPGGEGWMDVDYFDIKALNPQAMEPSPKYGATVFPGTDQLCWLNPDAGPGDIITCDVYLGTSEPDDLLADYGLTKIASGLWGSCVSIPFELESMQTYYWIVDCTDYNGGSPILLRGPTWTFTTGIAPTLVEAEDGYITGPEMRAATVVPGYSGDGYVTGFNQIDPPNEKVTVSFFAAEAGDYPLSMGFHSPYGDKAQYLFVNGDQKADAAFFGTEDWDVLDYGDVALEEGMNTITVSTRWGWFYLDYFMIQNLAPAASSPKPAHLSTAGTDLAQLCWTNPNPGPGDTITCDVYFGDDPNLLAPYDNFELPLLASGVSGDCVSIAGPLEPSHDYYWVVNCWDSEDGTPVFLRGGLWNFKTGNTPPVVTAGPNLQVWLGKDGVPGQVTVEIDATVTDDGLPSGTLTYLWTQQSGEATVEIDPDDTEDISLTFTEVGVYGFRLEASDTVFSRTSTMYVTVTETPCQAAMASSAYQPYDGDLDDDCYVSLSDFAMLASDWLNCTDPDGCQ